MSDFDIANLHGRSSFAASLQKRKMLGLDSDSEDEELPPRKMSSKKGRLSNTPKKEKKEKDLAFDLDDIPNDDSDIDTPTPTPTPAAAEPVTELDPFHKELQESLTATQQYLAAAEAIMSEPLPKAHRMNRSRLNNSNHTAAGSSSLESDPASFILLSDTEDLGEYTQLFDESEIADLDPALAALLEENAERGATQEAQKILIKLQYVHNLPNTSDKVKELMKILLKPMKIIIMDDEQFEKILMAFANHKKLKRDDLVLTYKDNYVYPQTTPAGIGMSDIGVNYMNVYPKSSYEMMKEDKEKKRREKLMRYTQHAAASKTTDELNAESATATEEEEHEQKIMLKLRGKDNKDVAMRAKYTTTLKSLLQHYKQITKNNENLKLRLDGDILDLDQTIQDVELEEDDMIEVV